MGWYDGIWGGWAVMGWLDSVEVDGQYERNCD